MGQGIDAGPALATAQHGPINSTGAFELEMTGRPRDQVEINIASW